MRPTKPVQKFICSVIGILTSIAGFKMDKMTKWQARSLRTTTLFGTLDDETNTCIDQREESVSAKLDLVFIVRPGHCETRVSNTCCNAQHTYWREELKDGVESWALWNSSKWYVGQKSPGALSQIMYEGKILNVPANVANGCQDAILGKVDKIMGDIQVMYTYPLDYTCDYVASKNKCTFTCLLVIWLEKAIKGLKVWCWRSWSFDHIWDLSRLC